MARLIASAFVALALGACASQVSQTAVSPSSDRDCFSSDMINGYDYIDEHSVAVRVGANRRYILTTEWNARDLNWEHVIAIRSTTNWICTGNGLGVTIIGGDPQRNYPVASIARAPEAPAPAPGS
jgi:hypothetical protein